MLSKSVNYATVIPILHLFLPLCLWDLSSQPGIEPRATTVKVLTTRSPGNSPPILFLCRKAHTLQYSTGAHI